QRADLRREHAGRGGVLRRRRAGLSLGGGRPDGARRRAADHDRRARRVHREDPLRAEGAADLFRRRAHRESSRRRKRRDAHGGGMTRRIWLCADDYGIAPGVNAAIRDLVTRGRLNATSVMVVAPSFSHAEANALSVLNADRQRAAIGLHLTLTGPLKPLTPDYTPIADGAFLPLATTLRLAMQQRLDMTALCAEIRAQFEAFAAAFGRPPDFVDGHQHVHLFPQVRQAALE